MNTRVRKARNIIGLGIAVTLVVTSPGCRIQEASAHPHPEQTCALSLVRMPSLRNLIVEEGSWDEREQFFRYVLRSPRTGKQAADALLAGLKHDFPSFHVHKMRTQFYSYAVGGRLGQFNVGCFVALCKPGKGRFADAPFSTDSSGTPGVMIYVSQIDPDVEREIRSAAQKRSR